MITFNYKEDAETVNFSDIEAALQSCGDGSDFKFPSSPKNQFHPWWGWFFHILSSGLEGSGVRKRAGGTFSPRPGRPAGRESRTGHQKSSPTSGGAVFLFISRGTRRERRQKTCGCTLQSRLPQRLLQAPLPDAKIKIPFSWSRGSAAIPTFCKKRKPERSDDANQPGRPILAGNGNHPKSMRKNGGGKARSTKCQEERSCH